MKVIATAVGYDNLVVRQVGDEFDMPEGSTAPWFVAVDAEPAPKAEKSAKASKGGKADEQIA